jgi:hypothetical protein
MYRSFVGLVLIVGLKRAFSKALFFLSLWYGAVFPKRPDRYRASLFRRYFVLVLPARLGIP